jgi:hypothetical protein
MTGEANEKCPNVAFVSAKKGERGEREDASLTCMRLAAIEIPAGSRFALEDFPLRLDCAAGSKERKLTTPRA